MTIDPLAVVAATWDTRTLEDVRRALTNIHPCDTCGWGYTSELAAAECCEPQWDDRPRD